MAQALVDLLRERHPDAVLSSHAFHGDDVVVLRRESLQDVCRFLKEGEADMKLLRDIAGVDLLTLATEMRGGGTLAAIEVPAYDLKTQRGREPRFYAAYNLYSVTRK